MNPNELPQRPQHNSLFDYVYSEEELRALRECRQEAFFQRALPLGTSFGMAAYFAEKKGFVRPNVRYGAVPKIVAGVVLGYFIGQFSYMNKCKEKIMALPDSRLAEMLKQQERKGGLAGYAADQSLSMGMTLGPFTPNPNDVYTDEDIQPAGKGNALNLDIESRPTFAGLDDIYRPNLDSPSTTMVESDIPLEPVKPGTSYEELRKRNREEYVKKQQNPLSKPLPPDAPVVSRQPINPSVPTRDENPNRSLHKNKYGDDWVE